MARKIKLAEKLPEGAPYELLVHLAAGGMGSVYIGAPRRFGGGLVAIKRAHPHLLEDAMFRKMFVSEATLAMRLATPHVVGVREVDESDGELLLVMEYVEGGSLAELMAAARTMETPISAGVVLRIVIDAALGLHQAHALEGVGGQPIGMVHRDISPQNILCGIDGRARIVDFGVAKAVDHEGTKTDTGVFKGKVAYMAPEYLRDRVVSPLIDVFGLGVVAWEAISGKRLFRGISEQETMLKIISDEPVPALTDVAAVAPIVARAVATALAKNPRDRFRSAAELASALESSGLAATRAELAKTVATLMATDLAERRALLRAGLKRVASGTMKLDSSRALPPAPSASAHPARAGAEGTGGGAALTPAPPSGDMPTTIAPPRAREQEEPSGSGPLSISRSPADDAGIQRSRASRRWVRAGLAGAVLLGAGVALLIVRGLAPPSSGRAAAPSEGAPTPSPSPPTPTASSLVSLQAVGSASSAASGAPPAPRPAAPTKWVPKHDPYAKQRTTPRVP